MEANHLAVSIVVCTYNRAGILMEALEALENQSADKSLYEVIIVNNNSTDHTQAVADSFVSRYDNVREVVEYRQGLSYARNRGFREASADWVAYIDDDARASSNYVERLMYVIRNYDFDCFGGVYLPWYKYARPKWFKDHYASNKGKLSLIGEVPENAYIDGGNCVFKKSLLEKYGGFSPAIGMQGNRISYGEETRLQIQLKRDGKKIGFDPELIVEHAVVPYKLRTTWYLKAAFSDGIAYWQTFHLEPSPLKIFRALMSTIISPVLLFPGSIKKFSDPEYYIQNLCLDLFTPSAGSLGKVIGAIKQKEKRK